MNQRKTAVLIANFAFFVASAQSATFSGASIFATAPGTATGPDSITAGFGSVWVSYTNGLDGIGLIHNPDGSTTPGNSTVVQYNLAGAIQNIYSLPGSIDGLKINPANGMVWALMNQDGNSSVDIINPATKTYTSLTYAVNSSSSGYDDIVFSGNKIFLSYTNPAASGDSTLVSLDNRISPLTVTPVLTYGASPSTLNDPDSLKQDASGRLFLTSGDDGALNIVSNPGAVNQSFRALPILSGGNPVSGLDDSFLPSSGQGNLYLTNTGANTVLVVSVTGLLPSDIYANVGSLNAFGQVNSVTGNFTPILSNLNAPHGLDFLSTPEPGTSALVGTGALLALIFLRRRSQA